MVSNSGHMSFLNEVFLPVIAIISSPGALNQNRQIIGVYCRTCCFIFDLFKIKSKHCCFQDSSAAASRQWSFIMCWTCTNVVNAIGTGKTTTQANWALAQDNGPRINIFLYIYFLRRYCCKGKTKTIQVLQQTIYRVNNK